MSFSYRTKTVALLRLYFGIPYEHAKLMTEDQIEMLFEWHHDVIPKSEGGPEVHWNALPMWKAEHRERTAKIDVPTIAKGKRIRAKQAKHEAARALDRAFESWAKSKRRSALRGRGFDKTRTRTVSGKVVPRKERRRDA